MEGLGTFQQGGRNHEGVQRCILARRELLALDLPSRISKDPQVEREEFDKAAMAFLVEITEKADENPAVIIDAEYIRKVAEEEP